MSKIKFNKLYLFLFFILFNCNKKKLVSMNSQRRVYQSFKIQNKKKYIKHRTNKISNFNILKKILFGIMLYSSLYLLHELTCQYNGSYDYLFYEYPLIHSNESISKNHSLVPKKIYNQLNPKVHDLNKIEKKIWIFWYQGWNDTNIPIVVKKCLKSWYFYNKDDGWEIILIDKYNLFQYIENEYIYFLENIYIQAFPDILRLYLLNKHGGIWTDATVFCNQRLDEWIKIYWYNDKFFAFSNPTPNKLIASWFLLSKLNGNNNYIIKKLYNKTMDFWIEDSGKIKNISNLNYYWLHKLFNNLYKNNYKFKNCWDNTLPKISVEVQPSKVGPHYLEYKHSLKINDDIKKHIDDKISPLYKLNWKLKEKEKSVLSYLFNTIEANNQNISSQSYNNIILFHIPKTGGTSIENALENKIKVGRFANVDFSCKKKRKIFKQCTIWHRPPCEFKSNSFVVVRNPIQRLLSEYLWVKDFDNNLNLSPFIKCKCKDFLIHTKIRLNSILKGVLNVEDCHYIKQWRYAKHANYFIRFENLNNELNKLFKDKFNMSIKIRNDNISDKNCNINETCIDNELKQLINTVYKDDFEFLNYPRFN